MVLPMATKLLLPDLIAFRSPAMVDVWIGTSLDTVVAVPTALSASKVLSLWKAFVLVVFDAKFASTILTRGIPSHSKSLGRPRHKSELD